MLLVEALYIWYGAVAFSGRARTSDDDPRVLFSAYFCCAGGCAGAGAGVAAGGGAGGGKLLFCGCAPGLIQQA